jgi:hypothetical protein
MKSTDTISYDDYLVLQNELNQSQKIVAEYAEEIEKLKALCRGFGIEGCWIKHPRIMYSILEDLLDDLLDKASELNDYLESKQSRQNSV